MLIIFFHTSTTTRVSTKRLQNKMVPLNIIIIMKLIAIECVVNMVVIAHTRTHTRVYICLLKLFAFTKSNKYVAHFASSVDFVQNS